MANNRQVPALRDMAFETLAKHSLFSVEIPAESTPDYHEKVMGVFVQMLNEKRMPKFLHAIADDDRKTVKEMLDVNPELIVIEPPKRLEIESKLTWNKFYAEKAFTMAIKRKQLEMVKLMLPYLDQIENSKAEVLAEWVVPPIADDIEASIPVEYGIYLKSLVNVFAEERFSDCKLSQKTEAALHSLFNMLLPKKAVKLDDYIDVELFFLAACLAYRNNDKAFQNQHQRNAFCIRVIGLIQSVLPPETGKVFCQGLYYVVKENRKISARADSLKLSDDMPFYRSSLQPRVGLGFDFMAGNAGTSLSRWGASSISSLLPIWKNYLKQVQQALGALRSDCSNSLTCSLQNASSRLV